MSGQGSCHVEALAMSLVAARQRGRALTLAADALPLDVATAYAVQDRTLAIGGSPPGWKVGYIAAGRRFGLPIERFLGPAVMVQQSARCPEPAAVQVIQGGFAAIEAELILRVSRDVPSVGSEIGRGGLRDLVDGVFVGIEVAGSPLPDILDRGPIGAICDHGNCLGLLVGSELDPALIDGATASAVSVRVDGALVGQGRTDGVPGGPLAALGFLLTSLAERGIGLPGGTMVATGALTGVHPVTSGQSAEVAFDGVPSLCVDID